MKKNSRIVEFVKSTFEFAKSIIDFMKSIIEFVQAYHQVIIGLATGALVTGVYFIPKKVVKEAVKEVVEAKIIPYYAPKIDSLRTIINQLNARIDTVRGVQRDSVYSSIASLHANFNSVTNEFQNLYNDHTDNHIRRDEIGQLRVKIAATVANSIKTEVAKLGSYIDSLNDEFGEHAKYSAKMDSTLKENVRDIREQSDITLAVRVFVGTEDTLKQQGYLSTPRFMLLFRQNYKIKNFPDSTNSKIDTVYIGKSFPVSGELVALCNYDGKLHEGKDYTVSKGQLDTTHVVLSRPMIAGQPILAVLKN